MQGRLPNTVRDWDMMLRRVYETQGPSGFAKYQYSISSILQLLKTSPNLKKLLEYCRDISNPRDVLIEAISSIMLDHSVDTDARVAAARTVKTLLPRMDNRPGLKVAAIVEAMKEVFEETGERSFKDALTDTINAANRRLRECPRAYTIKL